MIFSALLWLQAYSQVVTISPMLLAAPKIETNETKNDSRVPYDPYICMVWNVYDEIPWKTSMWKLNPSLKISPTWETGTLLCKDGLKQLKVCLLSQTNNRTATPSDMKQRNFKIPLLVLHPSKNHEYKIYIMKLTNNIIQMYIKKVPH